MGKCLDSENARSKDEARLDNALKLVLEQAEDEKLWLIPRKMSELERCAVEAHLQEALRALHEAIEPPYLPGNPIFKDS